MQLISVFRESSIFITLVLNDEILRIYQRVNLHVELLYD